MEELNYILKQAKRKHYGRIELYLKASQKVSLHKLG